MAPSFFTFFQAEVDNIELRIPIAFNQCIDEPLPEEVHLRDRNSNVWKVKVAKKGQDWFFVNGWNKFVSDNLLQSRDLLVFAYVSNNLFNVKLYGSEATEKNISGPSGGEEAGENDTNSATSSGDEAGDNDTDYETETDENDEGKQVVNKVAKCYGMEIFEAGLAERPAGPYFVGKRNPKRVTDLFIPSDVIKDYDLTFKEEITLIDPKGRQFPSNCRKWGDGRHVVSGGWASFCFVNEVNDNTSCICKFVQREDEQFLHISFVRY